MCSIMCFTDKALKPDEFREAFDRTIPRGPDKSAITETASGYLCYHRLAIMDMSDRGMQPFVKDGNMVICNGEIYGFRILMGQLKNLGYKFSSVSDCEVLLPMYEQYGTRMFRKLDAEYALVIYDGAHDRYIAARDPIGIRPLFYGFSKKTGSIIFASEACNLVGLCDRIKPFPPGYYYIGKAGAKEGEGIFTRYMDITTVEDYNQDSLEIACRTIREKLIKGVDKRLDADAPLGFLLSGGLDSSLVCAISAKILGKKIRTFAIGMDKDAIDLKYAREVADFIGAEHTEVYMTAQEVIDYLPTVIKTLGTWDITTIRASMGMYLLCKKIHETTDVHVLYTGEISDELFGYKYTDFAPDAESFQLEAEKRIRELHYYDVLRADRCISSNSMEGRVPFGDLAFVRYVMSIDPELKRNHYHMGKYLLRHAFEKDEILPKDILFRDKAAFSDAVGHSLADDLKEFAEQKYSDQAFEEGCRKYSWCPPYTKESLMYRDIFESFYPGMDDMIPAYWLPNQTWKGCQVTDPSARYLSNYGASGI